MKLTRSLAASAAATLTLALAGSGIVGSGIATADGNGAPANTGWDGIPNAIAGGGSDTTYPVMQALSNIYNRAPGCSTDNGAFSATKGDCAATQPTDVKTNGNYDHDPVTQNFPTGSSAGVLTLINAACTASTITQYNPPIQFARSSRGPAACANNTALSETDKDGGDLTFWGFATDGLIGLTYAGRSIPAITIQQIHDIYTCSITNWGQITGNSADNTATIIPFGMNASSGTYAAFNTLIQQKTGDTTFTADGSAGTACVHKLSSGVYPFENDAKPLLDPAQNGGLTAAQTQNIFWWGSFGEWASFPYKAQSGKIAPLSTCAPLNGTTCTSSRPIYIPNVTDLSSATPAYPLTRVIYHVTKKTDADWNATAQAVQPNTGIAHSGGDVFAAASSGASGAVRQFTNFLCTGNAQAFDSYFGTGLGGQSGLDIGIESGNVIQQQYNFGLIGNPTAGSACLVIR